MAGGTWLTQNKIRPGAYINFVGVPKPMMTIGDRGIATLALPLTWGAQGELIEVLSTQLLDGGSLPLVGVTAFDSDTQAKILRLVLSGCYKALVYRLDAGGVAAKATIGANLTATAKYPGTSGNKIIVSCVEEVEGSKNFVVRTFFDAVLKDTQKITAISDLKANDYVVFSGTGELEEHAGTPLSGGTDGTVTASTAYPQYLNLLRTERWQCGAVVDANNTTINPLIREFIEQMRDGAGRYVQFVVNDATNPSNEGIINSLNGAVINGETVTPQEFTAWVCGVTAGAQVNQSNAYRIVENATQIIGQLDDEKIKQALQNGVFLLSTRQDGTVIVEQDINSLHEFTPTKGYAFSKNRVIRTLDGFAMSVADRWEKSYIGKVSNNDSGREMFRSDIIALANEFQRIEALQNFDGASDTEVLPGTQIDAVVANVALQPVDSMEKLYMTINVGG